MKTRSFCVLVAMYVSFVNVEAVRLEVQEAQLNLCPD